MDKTICELFAGVGGFRLGFEKANSGSHSGNQEHEFNGQINAMLIILAIQWTKTENTTVVKIFLQ